MQVAEVLGLQPEDIAPTVVDTDTIGYTATTGGSRIAFDTGLAAIAAAEEVKQQMTARAALLWRRPVEDVVFNDGVFTCMAPPAERISFQELAGKLMSTGGAVTCSASANSTGVGLHLCREYCGRGGGPGDGEGANSALHDLSRRGSSGPPAM